MADENDRSTDEEIADEDWAKHLTKDLVTHFERQGRYLVEQQVLGLRYKSLEKRLAAMVWLSRKRKRDRLYAGILLVLPVVAALGGAYLGAWMSSRFTTEREEHKYAQDRLALIATLAADITALRTQENGRMAALDPLLKQLVEVSVPGGTHQPRPWLIAPVTQRFPVYEQNAGRLGALQSPLPTEVAEFYGLSYQLRSNINVVLSPAILLAGRPDKEFAVTQYKNTLAAWNMKAQKILDLLKSTTANR